MKFICLICTERIVERMSPAESEALFAEYLAFAKEIHAGGHYLGSDRLLPADTAVTVRVRDGRLSTTDGPFAETKEQLGGYFLIEARDLNEAIRIAAKIPGARNGCVEVRPVADQSRTIAALLGA